jgi:hypothetical protein
MGNDDVGTSADTAIVVRTLWAEYQWLQEHLPGGRIVYRKEIHTGDSILDVLTIQVDGRGPRDVFFDVSACAGQRPPTPPCPYCGEPLVTARAKQCRLCFADFHNPAQVVFRQGRDHVDRVRAMAARRRDAEASQPGLNDPRSTFNARFRITGGAPGVAVLHFPERLSALDTRVFQIGVECLIADGCRGVVCDVEEPSRHLSDATAGDATDEQVGLLIRYMTQLFRLGVRPVLVRGEAVRNHLAQFLPLESYACEADAIAAVMERRERG